MILSRPQQSKPKLTSRKAWMNDELQIPKASPDEDGQVNALWVDGIADTRETGQDSNTDFYQEIQKRISLTDEVPVPFRSYPMNGEKY